MNHRLLVVHAHPDDESITMGGTLAGCTDNGVAVTLVTCTLGEEGEIIAPELQGLAADRADQLGGYRHVELRAACAALGLTDHRYLGGIGGHRDSGMVGTASHAHPRALVQTATDGYAGPVTELLAILDEVRPQVVVSYDADGGYGHPDHIAAHHIARSAAARASSVRRFYAVVRPSSVVDGALAVFDAAPGYQPPQASDLGFRVSDDRISVRIPVLDQRERQRAALAAHATQVDVLPDGFALSNGIAQPLFDAEYYALLDGVPMPAGSVGVDLFAGLD